MKRVDRWGGGSCTCASRVIDEAVSQTMWMCAFILQCVVLRRSTQQILERLPIRTPAFIAESGTPQAFFRSAHAPSLQLLKDHHALGFKSDRKSASVEGRVACALISGILATRSPCFARSKDARRCPLLKIINLP